MNEKLISKSISELEGWKWKGKIPTKDDGYAEYRFYILHDKPISVLTLSDICFFILENTGLEYLVPIALSELRKNIFIEADLYEGDLLCALLLINNEPNYWKSHPKERQELIDLYSSQMKNPGSVNLSHEIIRKIKNEYNEFLNK